MSVKQVIVWRNDIKCRAGKKMSQSGHAAISWLLNRVYKMNNRPVFSAAEQEWMTTGQTKIVAQVDSEKELLDIYQKARDIGLEAYLIKDAGKTEFDAPTITCCGIGPDEASKIDPLTKHLELH